MQLPSTKVGIVLTIVVLVVVGTIFSTKITKKEVLVVDLKNVELVVERKTQENFKAGDSDGDTLPDWLEEFYKTEPQNADTDGDGTSDGEEIGLDRDPTIAGPNDPLITRKDLVQTEADMSKFTPGTITEKTSVDLFSQYIMLKKQGALTPEDESKLVNDLSKQVTEQASIRPHYSMVDLSIVETSQQSLLSYGERTAQVALTALTKMDTYQNLKDAEYFLALSKEYKTYADEMSRVTVPSTSQEVHLELINYLYRTSTFFETMVNADKDPLSSLVILSQYKTLIVDDIQIYTALSQYFKNNGIIFDTESTINFWQNFGY